MTDIEIGDVVRLKSGGPSMTVTHVYNARGNSKKDVRLRFSRMEDGEVCVVYFDEKGRTKKQNFEPILLEKEE